MKYVLPNNRTTPNVRRLTLVVLAAIGLNFLQMESSVYRVFAVGPLQVGDPQVVGDDNGKKVIARVADFEITLQAIEKLGDKRFPGVEESGELRPEQVLDFRRAAALGLVRRQLAMVRLLQLGGPASQAKIDRRLERELQSLRRVDANAELESETEQEIAWNVAWNEYLSKHLTDENLITFFDSHAWKYDGTSVSVSQIFQPPADNIQQELDDLKRKIVAGEISFSQAAREHSKAPSATHGGELGWVQYAGDLPRAVADAAFTSEMKKPIGPIQSPSGWHLIWVEEKREGEKTFAEVEDRASVQRDAADYLFNRLVNAGHELATVTWVDTTFKPPVPVTIQP